MLSDAKETIETRSSMDFNSTVSILSNILREQDNCLCGWEGPAETQ